VDLQKAFAGRSVFAGPASRHAVAFATEAPRLLRSRSDRIDEIADDGGDESENLNQSRLAVRSKGRIEDARALPCAHDETALQSSLELAKQQYPGRSDRTLTLSAAARRWG